MPKLTKIVTILSDNWQVVTGLLGFIIAGTIAWTLLGVRINYIEAQQILQDSTIKENYDEMQRDRSEFISSLHKIELGQEDIKKDTEWIKKYVQQ